MIGGTTTLVGLLRDPKVDSLSPRMQNAAFAALALDIAYVPLGVAPERLEDAVRGLVALGFRRRERDDAAQACRRRGLRRGRGRRRVREHARDPRRARARLEHGHGRARRPAAATRRCDRRRRGRDSLDRRAGGARRARRGLLPQGRVAAAHGDAELVVHATPVKDELLLSLAGGSDGDRPRLPRRRRRDRRTQPLPAPPGASSSTGSTCSSRRAPRHSSAGPGCQHRLTSCAPQYALPRERSLSPPPASRTGRRWSRF